MTHTETDLVPYQCSNTPSGVWLIFSPHPDDETFGMGGTIRNGADNGVDIYVDIITDGRKGGGMSSHDLISTRKQEAMDACLILGVKECFFWEIPDRSLVLSHELCNKIKQRINSINPSVIYIPSPFEYHPDHRKVTEITWEAIQLSCFSGRLFSYEITRQSQINFLVDTTDVASVKIEAMKSYGSQLSENNYIETITALNKSRTYTLDSTVSTAEGFFEYKNYKTESLSSNVFKSVSLYWDSLGSTHLPLVSIIVRTYNRPRLLAYAIESILEQSYRNIEIIIINDGGHDILDVINRYTQLTDHITYIKLDSNHGRSIAANIGLKKSTGQYISFLDDDDTIAPNHIQNLVHKIDKTPGINVVYSSVQQTNEDGSLCDGIFSSSYSATRLLTGNYIPIHAILFHRSLLELGVKMDEEIDLYEDWDFLLQLSRHSRFLHINNVTAYYRKGGESKVGLTADPVLIQQSANIILSKWRHLWGTNEISRLTSRAALSYELENETIKNSKELTAAQYKLNELTRENSKYKDLYKDTLNSYNETINSTSWSVSRPLRDLKNLSTKLQNRLENLVDYTYRTLDFGKPLNDKLTKVDGELSFSNKSLCMFSHYDKDSKIDNYVLLYLKALKEIGIDIIFVSTAGYLTDNNIKDALCYCDVVIQKENIGYDFGSWKSAVDFSGEDIKCYNELILCNDSVYAPLFDLNIMFDHMRKKDIDFWGVTDSQEISPHIQSYFIAFRSNIIQSNFLYSFFSNIRSYKYKKNIIDKYEIGLSEQLRSNNFTGDAYCSSYRLPDKTRRNISHFEWRKLIDVCNCPMIKIELLRDNPSNVDISEWKTLINRNTIYDVSVIDSHLSRVKD